MVQNCPVPVAFGTLNENGGIGHFKLSATLRAEIAIASFPAAEFIELIITKDLPFSLATRAGEVLLAYGTDCSFHSLPKILFTCICCAL